MADASSGTSMVTEPTRYDPFGPATLADPGAAYQELLARCPVHRYEGFDPPFYSFSRYADVQEALRDIRTYSSHYGQGPNMVVPGSMQSDPPQHTFFRRLVQQAFTPRAVADLRPRGGGARGQPHRRGR